MKVKLTHAQSQWLRILANVGTYHCSTMHKQTKRILIERGFIRMVFHVPGRAFKGYCITDAGREALQ